MLTKAAASRTRRSISSSLRPMLRGPKEMSLYTVSSKSWYSGYWNTSPTLKRMSRSLVLSSHHILPIDIDFAGGWFEQTVEVLDQRRFSRTGMADNAGPSLLPQWRG